MKKEAFCNISGNRLYYTREGSGETILLLHGISTYSFIWKKITPFLAKYFDVIAVDFIGCGNSDKPLNVDYSIKNQAEIIFQFIKKLNLEKVHLVSHDIGGGIAQILTVKYPQFISDSTLINSVAYDFWPVQPIIAVRTPIIRQLAMASLDLGAFRLVVKRGLFKKDILTDELMNLFWVPMKTKEGRKAFLRLVESLNNTDLLEIKDDLHKTNIPMLIIRGEEDIYLSADICETLHKNIKTSVLLKIPNSGHYMMEEEPEKISTAIINFINDNQNV